MATNAVAVVGISENIIILRNGAKTIDINDLGPTSSPVFIARLGMSTKESGGLNESDGG
jgi:hypothetical protein